MTDKGSGVPVPSRWHNEAVASRHCLQQLPRHRGAAGSPALARNRCRRRRAADNHIKNVNQLAFFATFSASSLSP